MRSLRERLGVAIGVTAVLSVFLTGIVAIGLLRRYSESTARSDLAKVARAIAAEDPDTVGTTVTLPLIRRVLAINGDQAAIVTRNGAVLGDAASIVDGINLQPLIAGQEISGTARTDAVPISAATVAN